MTPDQESSELARLSADYEGIPRRRNTGYWAEYHSANITDPDACVLCAAVIAILATTQASNAKFNSRDANELICHLSAKWRASIDRLVLAAIRALAGERRLAWTQTS